MCPRASLLYLHGFLSSPLSKKAVLTQQWLAREAVAMDFICPQLSSYPAEAKHQLDELIEQLSQPIFAIGSSLGGYWATYLTECNKVRKSVLINPAVAPQERFHEFVGQTLKSYYGRETYVLTDRDLDTLLLCDCPNIEFPEKYWLMVQKGDETLDYSLATARYSCCKQLVEEGGSHTFDGYESWLPKILQFFEEF